MNLSSLIQWALGIVLALAALNHVDDIHNSILKAQAQLIYEARTSTWGSPKFMREFAKR